MLGDLSGEGHVAIATVRHALSVELCATSGFKVFNGQFWGFLCQWRHEEKLK